MSDEKISVIPGRTRDGRTIPRFALRTFWWLHRAAYRLSGGRLGLSRPEAGATFGMMRLTTLGRRSGHARVAIVGYYEDGPNLVTLAMNGWGQHEPAWWLNLQTSPDATVDLPDGHRAVRARAASREERERLWAQFADYPGWGRDLEALAARRPHGTAIVVLEPRLGAESTSRAATEGRSSLAPGKRDEPSAAIVTRSTGRMPRPRLRHLWLVPGIGLALFANGQASHLSVGLVSVLVFSIVPDLPRFIGTNRPTMLALHNAAHNPVLVLGVLLGTVVTGISPFLLVGALASLGHIVVGWGTGDRVRSAGEPGTTVSGGFRRAGRLVLAPQAVEGR